MTMMIPGNDNVAPSIPLNGSFQRGSYAISLETNVEVVVEGFSLSCCLTSGLGVVLGRHAAAALLRPHPPTCYASSVDLDWHSINANPLIVFMILLVTLESPFAVIILGTRIICLAQQCSP